MSVDTYLEGKDTSGYRRVSHGDVEVLVAPSVFGRAQQITVHTKGALFWRSLGVSVAHEHGPT